MYTPAVLEHFKNPRHSGELPGATAVVEVSNPACGDILQLSAHIENGHFADVRFKARGCVTSIACGSLLTEMLLGKSLDEARAISPPQVADALGGLPPATVHGSQLACDAVAALLGKL